MEKNENWETMEEPKKRGFFRRGRPKKIEKSPVEVPKEKPEVTQEVIEKVIDEYAEKQPEISCPIIEQYKEQLEAARRAADAFKFERDKYKAIIDKVGYEIRGN